MPGMFESSASLTLMRTRDPDGGPEPLFSPHLSTMSVTNWPISFTEPSERSGISPPLWPAMPDMYARWPAKGPATDTISKFPSQLDFRVERATGEGKCVVCTDKLPKGSPQVSMRKNSGFRLTGSRCVTCVPPHTLRQAGGSEAVELDKVRPRPLSIPLPLCPPPSAPSARGATHHLSLQPTRHHAGASQAPEDPGPHRLPEHRARGLLPPLMPPPLTARRAPCDALCSRSAYDASPLQARASADVACCACTVDTALFLSVCMSYCACPCASRGMASIYFMFMMSPLPGVERAAAAARHSPQPPLYVYGFIFSRSLGDRHGRVQYICEAERE